MVRRLLAALSVSLIVCVTAMKLCVRFREDPVSRKIADRVLSSDPRPIQFAEITPFDWDRVYCFGCYQTRSEIENTLGFQWPKLGGSSIESSDGVTLIVFVKDGRVIRSFDHPRNRGDFSGIVNPHGLTKGQARFVVHRQGAGSDFHMTLYDVAAS